MKRLAQSIFFVATTFLFLLSGVLYAQDLNNTEYALGKVQFEISCSEGVVPSFNNAVALLHHMTYPMAKEAFEKVAAMDPDCAMAQWGIGMTLFQPLWPTRPGPEELKEGWESVRKAKTLNPPTRREQLFIETTEAFYRNPMDSNYWERISRWAEATKKLYEKFPDDPEVKAIFALSLLSEGQLHTDRLAYNNRAAEISLSIHANNEFHPEAITWFARGLGAVHNNALDESKRAISRIHELENVALQMSEDLFTKQIKILRLGVSAWVAHAENNDTLAESLMRQMAELETSTAKHPVTPAPTLPAFELLGDLMMEQGKYEEALAAYREALALYPQRFNSLLGVARAARALEDQQISTEFYNALMKIAAEGSNRSGLDEAMNYLQSGIKNK